MTADAARLRLPAGLRLIPADPAAAARATVLAVIAACLLVIAADWVMRDALPAVYRAHYTSPLWPRTGWTCLTALREEIVFRLGLQTALAAVPALWRSQAGPRWMVGAIAAAQLANIGVLALAWPPYGLVRFWLVGGIWGWLYWKHGFASALAGHGVSHLVLDPALRLVLA